MEVIGPCHRCKSFNCVVETATSTQHYVECKDCFLSGTAEYTIEDAINWWNYNANTIRNESDILSTINIVLQETNKLGLCVLHKVRASDGSHLFKIEKDSLIILEK